jgi:hypothetical protein
VTTLVEKMKKTTNAEKAERSGIGPRLINEEEAAIYIGISARTLQDLRGATPKRWTRETLKDAMSKGGIVPPPFVEVGSKRLYDIKKLDIWIDLLPQMGELPVKEMEG